MSAVATFLASVVTSSAVAATITGLLGDRNERKKQLQARRVLAGEFAGEAMNALVALRHYKPTNRAGHRNEGLHSSLRLQNARAEAVQDAIDGLRPLRGRVWVTFPGRSTREQLATSGPRTTADWAEHVINSLRDVERTCKHFWTKCGETPLDREALETSFDYQYDASKVGAWRALDGFASSASDWLEPRKRWHQRIAP
jgi:sugar phosphate isomerase/epimerase